MNELAPASSSWTPLSLSLVLLLVVQVPLLLLLLARLAPGRTRRPPESPDAQPSSHTSVSVIVATLNEAHRIGPCLDGLVLQGAPLLETLVVDSASADGTRELVQRAAQRDPRIRLVDDGPLPEGWVGKVWALENGLRHARGEWVLGIDADTIPAPGLVAAVVAAAERDGWDVASFAPRFEGQGSAERFLQPAMLVTLVYRCGAAGATQPAPDRVLANGQCFLARRELLLRNGGYCPARGSFSDDVTLARHLARGGARVGFLDGSRIIGVRAYRSAGEMWREWGRSFDLTDSTTALRRAVDLMLVVFVQALPLPVTLLLFSVLAGGGGDAMHASPAPDRLLQSLLLVNASALLVRLMMLVALRGSYATRGIAYWCSFLADVPAALRLIVSTLRRPRRWRGREYAVLGPAARDHQSATESCDCMTADERGPAVPARTSAD